MNGWHSNLNPIIQYGRQTKHGLHLNQSTVKCPFFVKVHEDCLRSWDVHIKYIENLVKVTVQESLFSGGGGDGAIYI